MARPLNIERERKSKRKPSNSNNTHKLIFKNFTLNDFQEIKQEESPMDVENHTVEAFGNYIDDSFMNREKYLNQKNYLTNISSVNYNLYILMIHFSKVQIHPHHGHSQIVHHNGMEIDQMNLMILVKLKQKQLRLHLIEKTVLQRLKLLQLINWVVEIVKKFHSCSEEIALIEEIVILYLLD